MDRVSSAGYQTINGIRCWQNMNLGAGIQGTTFDQVWFQGVQESIVAPVAKSGQTPTDSALGSPDVQLLNAILAFAGANVQAVTSTPASPLAALSAGLVVVNATSGNVAMTLPPSNGLGGMMQHWKFVRTDATSNTVTIALAGGDAMLIGSGSGFVLGPLAQLELRADGIGHWAAPQGRTVLAAALTLYVGGAGASDSNNGLSAAAPFATLQHAYNVLFANYDLAGNTVSIEVANGTYTAGLTCVGRCMGQSSAIAITGNTGSPSSCAIALSAAGSCFAVTQGAEISIAGFELSAPIGSSGLYAAGGLSLVAQLGGTIYYSSLIFGAAQYAHMAASNGGLIQPSANGQAYSIVGGAQYHAIAQSGGAEVSLAGCTVTLTGTPAFSAAFADADASGLIYAPSSGTSFSGSATGQRYSATNGGYISTGGGGASFFPGSSSGASSTGYYT